MIAAHPSFKTADSYDAWFKFISSGRIDLFWENHKAAKTKAFGPDFYKEDLKTLLTGMFEPDPSKRYKIIDVKESKWYNGPVASEPTILKEFSLYQEELAAYMLEEKEDRRKVKLEKLKEKQTAYGVGVTQGFKAYRGAEVFTKRKADRLILV